ncbi:hypothetical protein WKI68_43540 [Streptomyces sp. MS1.HAVA.3]|uniref:Uncharacterized protein n=1 Tax=Streptomyces caledonius TaxID=3134107 RepID=A0ABU8UEI4_9ACTN
MTTPSPASGSWTAHPVEGWTTRHSGDGLWLNCVHPEQIEDLRVFRVCFRITP